MGSNSDGVSSRRPAEYGRAVVRRMALRTAGALIVLALVPSVLLFVIGLDSVAVLGIDAIVIIVALALDRLMTPRLERRARGNEAEIQVGTVLDDLADRGWLTVHDIDTGHGNIDHITVGPGGLLTVETKRARGRMRVAALNPRWLAQAYAQRKFVEKLTGLKTDCLLVVCNAYLDRARSRQRGVLVVPARLLAGHLERCEVRLSAEEVTSIHRRLVSALDASGLTGS